VSNVKEGGIRGDMGYRRQHTHAQIVGASMRRHCARLKKAEKDSDENDTTPLSLANNCGEIGRDDEVVR
jgi:hypothetical protein